jgi:pimeloyl-ACP methyl ester carboxylesterase
MLFTKSLYMLTIHKVKRVSLNLFIPLLLILTSCQTGKKASQENPRPFPNSHFTVVGGVRLHYRIWPGRGNLQQESVLLLHGFSGSTFSWETTAPALQALGYEVIALDIPPFGYSDKSPGVNASVTARAALLLQWIDENFPSRKWHLVGHSMGAGIVQAMALMKPEKAASVIFVAGAVFNEVKLNETRSRSLLHFRLVQALAGNLAETHFITRRRIAKLLESAYGSKPAPEAIEAYYRALKMPGTARAILAGSTHSFEIQSLNASNLELPVLAIWGENDTWVPLASRQKVLERLPNVRLEIIPDTGHNPMETHHGEFNKHLLDFLLKISED